MSIAVTEIDDALAARGFETRFSVADTLTTYTVTSGGRELEILDAVTPDGGAFEPSGFFEAILYSPDGFRTVTGALEGLETMPELVGALVDQFN